jgi:hypothetical protein
MRATGGFIALLVLSTPLWAAEPTPAVQIVLLKSNAIDFRVGEHLVTRYHTDEKHAKPYFYPLQPLPDKGVTRSWPIEEGGDEKKDHIHHRSLWFCHGDVIPEGMEFVRSSDKRVRGVDFWSESKNHGKIVVVDTKVDGNRLITRNEWREPGGKKVLDETRMLTLLPIQKNAYLLIFDIDLHAVDYPITFGDTKEGSLGVRVRKTIALDTSNKKGEMINDKGDRGELTTWGRIANWVDYSGPLGPDAPVGGVTLMADPKNPIDTAWHARAYGLLAANPFGRAGSFPGRKGNTSLVKIPKGEHLKLRYGVYIHAGDVKTGGVAEAFKVFCK